VKTAFCTISTHSHLFKSLTLLESVRGVSKADLFCLITDSNKLERQENFKCHYLEDLEFWASVEQQKKYNDDSLRWSLKPVYLKFLLEEGYHSVIYCDNDIYFYDSPQFLFEKLKEKSFLLTPHFYPTNPQKDQNWLEANFRVGLYNAGFIGVSKRGVEILDWWTKCCLYNVKKAYWRGLYDDQKYLDLVPVIFDGVEVVKHRGCNFAGWNYDEVLIGKKDNQLFINNDQLVFIHFAQLSMERFSNTESQVYPYYQKYLKALVKHNPNFEFKGKKRTLSAISTYFYYLRWNLVRLFEK
jgi:hypothetical protein